MKIALLGAPGAGKSMVARRLATRLNKLAKTQVGAPPLGQPWKVIDGYVEKLTLRTGAQFGPDQSIWSYRYHMQVAGERWTLEDEAWNTGFNSITCGAIYEGIIYAAAQGSIIPLLGNEQLMLEETQVSNLMMQSFGMLAARTWDYDALFFLPLSVSDETSWSGVVNAKLPEVLEGQNRVALPLMGTDRQKVDRAEEVITEIQKTIAVDEQRSVSEGEVSSERDEPEPEFVPHVPSEEG